MRVPGSRRSRVGVPREKKCAHCGATMVLPPKVASRKLRCSPACDLDCGLDKSGPPHPVLGTPCWAWTRGKNNGGYGAMQVDRKWTQAHRRAWELGNGPIPEGLFVLHRCDDRPCCNPGHLFVGTQVENMQDAIGKGRTCMGDRHHARSKPELIPRGEEHWGSKLTAEQVLEIRASAGQVKRKDLADRFGVSTATIGRVVRMDNWRSV